MTEGPNGEGSLGAVVHVQGAPAETVTPTPPQYETGAIRQDPDTLAVAIRTNIPDPDSSHDWGVMTVDRGGHYAGWDEVASWTEK
jgi:hypothetical protein